MDHLSSIHKHLEPQVGVSFVIRCLCDQELISVTRNRCLCGAKDAYDIL